MVTRDATTSDRANGTDGTDEADGGHLADLPDGCGCAEVWEHLSDRRAADD